MVGGILARVLLPTFPEQFVVRKAFLFATVVFAVLACSPAKTPEASAAPPDAAADVAKFKAMEDQWYDLYHKGDADGIVNLYADDAQVLAAGAPAAVGKAAIR